MEKLFTISLPNCYDTGVMVSDILKEIKDRTECTVAVVYDTECHKIETTSVEFVMAFIMWMERLAVPIGVTIKTTNPEDGGQ